MRKMETLLLLSPELSVEQRETILSTMDGVEVLAALGELTPRPKVLVVSQFSSGNVANLAAAGGADYFMLKPCKPTSVCERIRQMAAPAFPAEDAARVGGVNMEGPFIAEGRKGAQLAEHILPPDIGLLRHWREISGGLVKLIDVAPEQPGGMAFVKAARELCHVSIAHTVADYDQAKAAFDAGIDHATHLFNAMAGLHHREPGVVGAVFDDDRVYAEMICDGLHLHPAVLRTAFRLLGDRAMVISDCMRAGGMPEGETAELGGQTVYVKNGRATLADGTLAGSVTNLLDEVRNLVRFGIPLEQAVKAASYTPARSLGLEKDIGSIAPGKRADLLVLDDELQLMGVYH